MLPGFAENPHRGRTRPDQIPHRLVGRVWYPNRRQLSGPVELRQHHCITAVSLHPVPGLHRDERGCDHNALVPHLDRLAVQTVTARPRLITKMQTGSGRTQPKLKARNFENQKTEANIGVRVLNRMTELGRPEFKRVA